MADKLQRFLLVAPGDDRQLDIAVERDREVRQHAHHEGQLDFLFSPVDFHVILDLHPRSAIAADKFLTARFCHG